MLLHNKTVQPARCVSGVSEQRRALLGCNRSRLVPRCVAASSHRAGAPANGAHPDVKPGSTPGSTLYTPANALPQTSTSAAAKDAASSQAPSSCMGTLLLSCPDQKGVIAAVAQLLFGFGCNVVSVPRLLAA